MSQRPSFKDRFLSKDREEAPEASQSVYAVKRKDVKMSSVATGRDLPAEEAPGIDGQSVRFTLYMDSKVEAKLEAEKRRRRASGQGRRETSINALVNEAILAYYK